MSLSLLSVDSHSVSDSYSTLLCIDITTSGTIIIRKCLPEFVALTVLLELPALSSLFSVSITLPLGVFRNGLFTYCGVDSKC